MIKFTSFDLHNSDGTYIRFYSDELIKTAEYSSELKDRLAKLEKKAGKTYVLVNAMGSGETWGSNRNGDYFPDVALSRDHKTFEKLGHAYKHHVNKDPEKSFGQVKVSVFNPDMHRVELVIELDDARAKEILDRIEKGEYPAVSMGTKVPYDICSICGKKSKRISDYCNHFKFEMNTILPDGRKVYAINDTDLKFFDISFVRIPADRTASVLSKVAEIKGAIPSAAIAQEELKKAGVKESAISKMVDGVVDAVDTDPKRLIYGSQIDMPKDELKQILNDHSLKEVLATFLGMRIVPKPMEFQTIVLTKAGQAKLAERAESENKLLMDLDEEMEVPSDLSLEAFNDKLAEKIAHWAPGMSLSKPHIMRRVLVKRAELATNPTPAVITINPGVHSPKTILPESSTFSPTKNPLVPMLGLGALYIGYNSLMNTIGLGKTIGQVSEFERFLLSKPWLIPIVLGAAAMGTVGVQDALFNKNAAIGFPTRVLIGVPASYLYAGSQEAKLQKGEPITEFGDFVRRHPAITGVATTVGIGQMQKLLKMKPLSKLASADIIDRLASGLTPEKFDQLYNDIIDVTP